LREESRIIMEKLLPGEYIIIFKAAAADLTNSELRAQFHTILKRGNLWQK
jgi:RNase P protein component